MTWSTVNEAATLRGRLRTCYLHYEALVEKNVRLMARRWKTTFLLLVGPLLFVALLAILLSVVEAQQKVPNASEPKVWHLDPLSGDDGRVFMFSPKNSTAVTSLMKRVARMNDLEYGTDGDVVPCKDLADISGYFYDSSTSSDYAHALQVGIEFQVDSFGEWPDDNRITFVAWRPDPSRDSQDFMWDEKLMSAQRMIQEAVLASVGDTRSASIDVSVQTMPNTGLADVKYQVTSSSPITFLQYFAPVIVGCSCMLPFVMVVYVLMSEKRNKMLSAMRMMGLKEVSYWLSWLTFFTVISILSMLLFTLVARKTSASVLYRVDFGTLFVAMSFFQIAMVALAFFVTSLVQKPRTAYIVSFALLALSLAVMIVAAMVTYGTNSYTDNSYETFTDMLVYDPRRGKAFLRYLFAFLPTYNIARIFDNINFIVQDRFDYDSYTGRTVTTKGEHFTWHDFTHARTIYVLNDDGFYSFDSPSSGYSVGLMIMNTVLYTFLAWYFGQVLAGENGASRPFYFVFQPSYWLPKKAMAMPVDGDTLAQEQRKSQDEKSIRLHKVSKTYENASALKEISLTMKPGEVTCLLGHNGAGKTTSINIITGQTEPTHGQAFVGGLSVVDEMHLIRPLMGCCPQEDHLWPDLSARDHLRLYARFKGTPRRALNVVADNLLARVQLTDFAQQPTTSFSGGMKRRLSVAISFVGDPTVIFLDEPTTGLDPLSRSRVWKLIQEMKEDRVVLLTTHSMEEADVLSDTIAILATGRMRASGTPLFLKNRFGAGYQANVLCESDDVETVVGLIRKAMPKSEILDASAGNISISIPRANSKTQIPAFFKFVGQDGVEFVKEWGISHTTLEEVFLRLAQQSREVNEMVTDFANIEEDKLCALCNDRLAETVIIYTSLGVGVEVANVLCSQCCPPVPGGTHAALPPAVAEATGKTGDNETQGAAPAHEGELDADDFSAVGFQQKQSAKVVEESVDPALGKPKRPELMKRDDPQALFRGQSLRVQTHAQLNKKFRIKLRQRKTNVCQFLFPMIVMLILWALKLSGIIGGGLTVNNDSCSWQYNYGNYGGYGGMQCNKKGFQQAVHAISENRQPQWPNSTQSARYSNEPEYPTNWGSIATGPTPGNQPVDMSNIWLQSSSDSAIESFETLTQDFSWWNKDWNNPPPFTFNRVSDVDKLMRERQSLIAQMYDNGTLPAYNEEVGFNLSVSLFPNLALEISRMSVTSDIISAKYTMRPYLTTYGNNQGWPNVGISIQGYGPGSGNTIMPNYYGTDGMSMLILQTQIVNGMLAEVTPGNEVAPQVFGALQQFPSIKDWRENSQRFIAALGTALYLMACMYLLPTFVHSVVTEREEGAFDLMIVMGVRMRFYWLAMYLFDFALSLFSSVVIITFGRVMKIPPFDGSLAAPIGRVIALLLVWCHAQVGIAAFLVSLLSKGRFAVILTYVLLLGSISLGIVINLFVDPIPVYAFFFLPLALARGWFMLLQNEYSDFTAVVLILFFFGTFLFLLGVAIFHSTQFHIRWPWSADNSKTSTTAARRAAAKKATEKSLLLPVNERGDRLLSGVLPTQDEDVIAEVKTVDGIMSRPAGEARGQYMRQEYPIVIEHLAKEFGRRGKGHTLAVDDLSIAVRRGECFGLLGPNGAGKTTTISVLHDKLASSFGQTFLGGYESHGERDHIHHLLGVTLQFDALWAELSVYETLKFYARIKGCPPELLSAVIQQTAEMVELSGDALHQLSTQLSGGQKRLLSIGVAIVGNPLVVLLDEPTTGLDPVTRHTAWQVISRASVDRSIILTTHSMEEADALCSRIGIMAKGSLKCVGSPLHLKNKFGEGFRLTCNVTSEVVDGRPGSEVAEEFIKRVLPDARLVKSVGSSWTFVLPRASVDVARIFIEFSRDSVRRFIHEWSLAQSSLEEVFIGVVSASDGDAGVADANEAMIHRVNFNQ